MSALVVGCGYLGRPVAQLLRALGDTVTGTVRSAASADALRREGTTPRVLDVLGPVGPIGAPERVFHAVGYDRSAGASMRDVYVEGLSKVLDRLSEAAPGRLVLASTTGVYGARDGCWVDEESPAGPSSEPGRVCLEAEEVVRAFAARTGWRAVVLRFAGLYGPGRVIGRLGLEHDRPIEGDPDHWLNLVHVEDAAACATAALTHPSPGRLYVVSDERPVRRRAYYELAARCLGLGPPRFAARSSVPSRRDASNKRVASGRVREELGVLFRFPDITTGLPAAIRADQSTGAGSM